MNESHSTDCRVGQWVSAWVSVVLAVSAALTLGFWLVRAVGAEDNEALESPLMLSVARQLLAGPGGLYGPFGGSNPLVLIHAPLYYRTAALVAWPMAAAGVEPITAARVAGRSISALGLLVTLGAAYRLARLGGAPRRAGWWAVLLIAAVPVLAGQPVAVRPDMAGVALQTVGVLLVLEALHTKGSQGPRLLLASAAFGLAVCVKQHFVMPATISTWLLITGWWQGQVRWRLLGRSLLLGATVAAVVYGLEGLVTEGRIWQAAFLAAGAVGRVHPADWGHVTLTWLGIIHMTVGLIVLLVAAGLAAVGARSGMIRKTIAIAGTGWVGFILVLLALRRAGSDPTLGALTVVATMGAMIVVIPLCAMIGRSSFLGGRIDGEFWLYLIGEVALSTVLFGMSSGAWSNYAIQAVVFGSVVTARAVARVAETPTLARGWVLLPVALAVWGILACAANDVVNFALQTRADRAAVEQIVAHVGRPRAAFFFTDRPGFNRLDGRPDLVYDDWLYPVFERLGLAEPRTRWLAAPLASGPVRVVVKSSQDARIEGVEPSLYALGYLPDVKAGPFYVWRR
jgi:hypothetical protein